MYWTWNMPCLEQDLFWIWRVLLSVSIRCLWSCQSFCSYWHWQKFNCKSLLDTWVSAGTAQFYVTDDNKAVHWRNGDLVCQNPRYCFHKIEWFLQWPLTLYEHTVCPNSKHSAEEHGQGWVIHQWIGQNKELKFQSVYGSSLTLNYRKVFCADWQKLRYYQMHRDDQGRFWSILIYKVLVDPWWYF